MASFIDGTPRPRRKEEGMEKKGEEAACGSRLRMPKKENAAVPADAEGLEADEGPGLRDEACSRG